MHSVIHRKKEFFLRACMTVLLSITTMFPAQAQTWKQQNKTMLPLVAENSTCNTSADTIALAIDRSRLLVCQSGTWTKQGGGISMPLYLKIAQYLAVPAACPAGWTQADLRLVADGYGTNNTRTCIAPETKSCMVVYLENNDALNPPAMCPAGWSQADLQSVIGGNGFNIRRSCYKC